MRWGLLLKIAITIAALLVVTAVVGLYASMRPPRIVSKATPGDFALPLEKADLKEPHPKTVPSMVLEGLYNSVGGEATVTVKKTGEESIYVSGLATWHGAGEMVNTGDLDGEATVQGNTAIYRKGECEATLTFGPATLTVEDNLKCGGLNVTFTGEYNRM
jgi:hypothetical protein